MEKLKELGWIASSKKDLIEFPPGIRKSMGHALYIAQMGGKHKDAKPLKGFGSAAVLEIVQMMEMELIEQCIQYNLKILSTFCMPSKKNLKLELKRLSRIWI